MIVDRKKDLFKGDTGEYVSLSKVESFIRLSPHGEFPMVYGRTGAKTVSSIDEPIRTIAYRTIASNFFTGG